eukprot:10913452-Lingulodinium_polyedra.AAC.1
MVLWTFASGSENDDGNAGLGGEAGLHAKRRRTGRGNRRPWQGLGPQSSSAVSHRALPPALPRTY